METYPNLQKQTQPRNLTCSKVSFFFFWATLVFGGVRWVVRLFPPAWPVCTCCQPLFEEPGSFLQKLEDFGGHFDLGAQAVKSSPHGKTWGVMQPNAAQKLCLDSCLGAIPEGAFDRLFVFPGLMLWRVLS